MEITPFNLLLLDALIHSLLLVNGLTGDALAIMEYPAEFTPAGLCLTSNNAKAYIPAVSKSGDGAIFIANLENYSLYRLPIELPHPMQFALAPDDITIYFTTPDSTLYILNTMTFELKKCGQAGHESLSCVGLAASTEGIYSAWEYENCGILAIFNPDGQLIGEHRINGIPTNIIYDKNGTLMMPFTSNGHCGEGLFILRIRKDVKPAVITVQCSECSHSNGAYPCQVAVSPDGQTAYVVNEDSGTVTLVDIRNAVVIDHFSLGRSISSLVILPDSRFAVASSNMFGDLALIDLVNGRLLSMSDGQSELLGSIAVLPSTN